MCILWETPLVTEGNERRQSGEGTVWERSLTDRALQLPSFSLYIPNNSLAQFATHTPKHCPILSGSPDTSIAYLMKICVNIYQNKWQAWDLLSSFFS